jgi:hypothetical protein
VSGAIELKRSTRIAVLVFFFFSLREYYYTRNLFRKNLPRFMPLTIFKKNFPLKNIKEEREMVP